MYLEKESEKSLLQKMFCERRALLENKAVYLWRIWGERYRTNVSKYYELVDEKRRLGIRPLQIVSTEMIRDYPEIELLRYTTEDALKRYIGGLSDAQLEWRIEETTSIVNYNCSFRTITERVKLFETQIRNKDKPKRCVFGIRADIQKL